MKDTIRYLYNRLTLKKHQVDCLCLPKYDSVGDIPCYTHGSVIVMVSPYANHRMNLKSLKVVLEEFKVHAAMEQKKRKSDKKEQEVIKNGNSE